MKIYDIINESTGVTDYNPKSQGGTRKELLAKYHKSKDPKDAAAARKAGATQKELQGVAEGFGAYDNDKGIRHTRESLVAKLEALPKGDEEFEWHKNRAIYHLKQGNMIRARYYMAKMKRGEQGVSEGSEPQVGDEVYYGTRLVGWFKGYSKHGKIVTKPNEEEMGDEYTNRDVYWEPQDKITIKPKQGVAEGFLGDREYNRVMPFVKRIASEVSDYDRDEFGEELWSLLDQKYGPKFAQSVLDDIDFYWDTYTELTDQQGVAEGEYDPSYDPEYRPYQKPEQDPDAWKQDRDNADEKESNSIVYIIDNETNEVVLRFKSTGEFWGDIKHAAKHGYDTDSGRFDIKWKRKNIAETATAGATSAGNVGVGAVYKNKPAKQAKNKDGTAKNALDMKANLLTGGSIKR